MNNLVRQAARDHGLYRLHLFVRQLASWIVSRPALLYHVKAVVPVGAQEKMRNVYAQWIVARMANTHAGWDCSVSECPGDAMNKICLATVLDLSVHGSLPSIFYAPAAGLFRSFSELLLHCSLPRVNTGTQRFVAAFSRAELRPADYCRGRFEREISRALLTCQRRFGHLRIITLRARDGNPQRALT